jgi:uncharacterized integral membrane protein
MDELEKHALDGLLNSTQSGLKWGIILGVGFVLLLVIFNNFNTTGV